jgi:hypothetical protein
MIFLLRQLFGTKVLRGARYLMVENLKVVMDAFSTVSLAVLSQSMYTANSRVENSARPISSSIILPKVFLSVLVLFTLPMKPSLIPTEARREGPVKMTSSLRELFF